MDRKVSKTIAAIVLLGSTAAYAQQYPILDKVADRVVQKYQSSSCEQLWQNRGKHQAGGEEAKLIGFLRKDDQMRKHFFDRIAGPVVNKMFECGMIP
jgi:hypothetical protein